MKRVAQAIGLVVLVSLSSMAEAGLFGFGGDSWQEEVLQHDGSKIMVERRIERGGRHEIGQKPPYKEQRLRFTMPGTSQTVTWEDHYSDDLGQANFLPMALDIVEGMPYLVVYPMGCLSYNNWGRPNPPYVVFRYQANEWKRIPLEQLPQAITTPNMMFSEPDAQVERFGIRVITADMIKGVIAGYQQPEYRTLRREAYPTAAGQCSEMIRTKDGWEGLGFFKHQPSYDACSKYCERKGVSQQNCPCETFFKRN